MHQVRLCAVLFCTPFDFGGLLLPLKGVSNKKSINVKHYEHILLQVFVPYNKVVLLIKQI